MDVRIVTPGKTSPSGLRKKLRSSLRILPCFKDKNSHGHGGGSISAPTTPHGCSSATPKSARSNYLGLSTPKSARSYQYNEFSDLKDKCGKAIGRMGRHNHSGRRHYSGDFKYDKLSYSLNFDREDPNEVEDGFPLRNFLMRLPDSPTKESPAGAASPASTPKEISACSSHGRNEHRITTKEMQNYPSSPINKAKTMITPEAIYVMISIFREEVPVVSY